MSSRPARVCVKFRIGRLGDVMKAMIYFTLQTMIGLAVGGDGTEPRSRLARKSIGPHFFHSKRYLPDPIPPPPPVRGGGGKPLIRIAS